MDDKVWIHTRALFLKSDEDDEISKIINGGNDLIWSNFSFRKDLVESYNTSSRDGKCTIRLVSGFDITIDMSYSEVKSIFSNC